MVIQKFKRSKSSINSKSKLNNKLNNKLNKKYKNKSKKSKSKKSNSNSKSKSNSKSNNTRQIKNYKSKYSKTTNSRHNLVQFHHRQNGGFGSSCNLATVKEPGFSVDKLGAISGLSISEASAAIYRPNCVKGNAYQAMTP